MLSLILRNLFFTLLQPGIVVGLLPFWIGRHQLNQVLEGEWNQQQFLGLIVFAVGMVVLLHCILRFVLTGRGTISPADPTHQLVVSGLYKYSRNPMYIGVVMILVGEAVFVGAFSLWLYTFVVWSCIHLFIVYKEEPRLKKDFGEAYETYCQKVGRWI